MIDFLVVSPQRWRWLGALLVWLVGLSACSKPSYDYTTLPDPQKAPYRLQPGDILHIRVLGNQITTGRYTVSPDGHINLPLGGQVAVMGLTVKEVRGRLVEELSKYLEDAGEMISVALERVRGIRYSVIGEVTRAGSYESPSYVTVLEALANAGGFNNFAQPDKIYVMRNLGNERQVIPFSYTWTIKHPATAMNFYLLPGDIVVVP